MPRYSKVLKLGTILNAINASEFVLITYNHGRNTWSGPAGVAETNFKEELATEVIEITGQEGGAIKIFI